MRLSLVSLRGIEFDGDAESLNIKTQSGEITVLDHHRPIITLISKGDAVITKQGGEKITLPIMSGFLEVDSKNMVTALVD